VPGGACSLGNPFDATVITDGRRKLDAGKATESIAFRDSSGAFTDETGAFGKPEWLMQWGHRSTGCSTPSSEVPVKVLPVEGRVDMFSVTISPMTMPSIVDMSYMPRIVTRSIDLSSVAISSWVHEDLGGYLTVFAKQHPRPCMRGQKAAANTWPRLLKPSSKARAIKKGCLVFIAFNWGAYCI
jgi:hypothetical protein